MAGARFTEQLERSTSGQEIAEVDWGSTDLGEISTWPRSLKALVSAVLACPTPIVSRGVV